MVIIFIRAQHFQPLVYYSGLKIFAARERCLGYDPKRPGKYDLFESGFLKRADTYFFETFWKLHGLQIFAS